MKKVKQISYEVAVTVWNIFIESALFSLPFITILFSGMIWKLLGW